MTTTLDIEKIVCRRCYAVLDAGDNFCRHCGAPTGNSDVPAAATAQLVADRSAGVSKWSENRWVVLAMLLLVLGPLGLPMLWRSRQFSLFWKAMLTAFLLGVTVAIIGLIWYVLHEALRPLTQLRGMKGF